MPQKLQSKWLDLDNNYVFTGDVEVPSPTLPAQAAPKGYVDSLTNSVAKLIVDDLLYTDSTNQVIALSTTVANYNEVVVSVIGGTTLEYGADYTIRFVGVQAYICLDPSSTPTAGSFDGGDTQNPSPGFSLLIPNVDEVKAIYSSSGPGGNAAGFQGPSGNGGVQGSIGPIGLQGSSGGPQGLSGVQGFMGPMGPFGGPQGNDGAQGPSSAPTLIPVIQSNNSSNQSDNIAFTTLNFDTDLVSQLGDISHDSIVTPSIYTINISGTYEISYRISNGASTSNQVQVMRNGTQISQSFASAGFSLDTMHTFTAQFTAGDVITLQARFTVAATGGGWLANQTYFEIKRLVGVKGDSGVQGPLGFQGIPGPVTFGGPQGTMGTQGTGGTGPQGFSGSKGFQGSVGVQGPAEGPQGLQGPAFSGGPESIVQDISGLTTDSYANVFDITETNAIAVCSFDIQNTGTNPMIFRQTTIDSFGNPSISYAQVAAGAIASGNTAGSFTDSFAKAEFILDVKSFNAGQATAYVCHVRGVGAGQGFQGGNGIQGPAGADGVQGVAGSGGLVGEICDQSGGDANAGGFNTSATGFQSFAVGFQTTAGGLYSFAEGSGSVSNGTASHAEGINTDATAAAAHAEGQGTFANGVNSHAEGQSTTSSGQSSHAQGISSKASLYAQDSQAAGIFNAQGDAQTSNVVLFNATTDATPTDLFLDGPAATQLLTINDNATYGYSTKIIARQTGGTSACALFELSGFITRDSGVGTTRVLSGSLIYVGDGSTSTWTVAASADATNGALVFTVTGEASKNIQWVAHTRLIETFES